MRLVIFLCATLFVSCNCGGRLIVSSADLAVEPARVDFGEWPPGTRRERTITVTNRGGATLTLETVEVRGDARRAFDVELHGNVLQAGESLQLEVSYVAPAAPGADHAELWIEELVVPLSGASTTVCLEDCGGHDAGSEPPDAGTPPVDAGAPVVDAGMSDTDAGEPPVQCAEPDTTRWSFLAQPSACGPVATNISVGGVFHGNTCTGADLFQTQCNPLGTPESLFYVPLTGDPTGGPSYYPVCLTDGFTWFTAAAAMSNCAYVGPGPDAGVRLGCNRSCTPTGCVTQDNIGFSQSNHFWVGVERLGGGCGPFTIVWTRVH